MSHASVLAAKERIQCVERGEIKFREKKAAASSIISREHFTLASYRISRAFHSRVAEKHDAR